MRGLHSQSEHDLYHLRIPPHNQADNPPERRRLSFPEISVEPSKPEEKIGEADEKTDLSVAENVLEAVAK